MNRQQMLKKIETPWTMLNEAYAGLSEAQMLEPGVAGDWSVKDILAHVTIWEEEALKHLPGIIEGKTPPRYSEKYGGIDAFNDLMMAQKKGLSLSQVLSESEATHRRFVEYVESVPEEYYVRETRFRHRLKLDTYSHYALHAKMIREWREKAAK